MHHRQLHAAVLLLALFALPAAGANEIFSDGFESGDTSAWSSASDRETIRVLFVGNSYTSYQSMPARVAAIGSSPGSVHQVVTSSWAIGGYTWEQHSTDPGTLAKIDEGWDVVVLQDQSQQPEFLPTTVKAAALTLDARVQAAGGTTVLYMTWPKAYHGLQTQHYFPLYYNNHGHALGAEVAPVGRAWSRSLLENPALTLHSSDDSHPNARGAYLTAAVFYATLTGYSPVGLTGGASGLTVAERDALQAVAWATYHGARRNSPTAPAVPADAPRIHQPLSNAAVEDVFRTADLNLGAAGGPGTGNGTFFGGNGLVSLPYTPDLHPAGAMTFAVFAHRADWSLPTALQVLVHNADAFALEQNGTDVRARVRTAGSGAVEVSSTVAGLASGWHHFAVTYDSAEVRLWIDGSAVDSIAAAGGLTHGTGSPYSSLVLGAAGAYPGPNAVNSGFAGTLADFRLYHRALADAEVAELATP